MTHQFLLILLLVCMLAGIFTDPYDSTKVVIEYAMRRRLEYDPTCVYETFTRG